MRKAALSRLAWTVVMGAAYVWPIDEPVAPTATFGEYRSRHFHGGLDLSTHETIGLPVRALDDGQVARVRCSGTGYGRALYLLLQDGRTVVYGHLDGFAPDLEAWLASVQDSTGSYEQDLEPPAGRFRYRRGDVVAYTGGSGAGPPHLHVELREGDTGLNPLDQGLPVSDTVAPSLVAFWVYPASAAARVEGGILPVRVPFRRSAGETYQATRALRVEGPIRAALEGFDRTQARPNPLGIFGLGARLDGDSVFEARFDSVSWLETVESEVLFDARLRGRGVEAYALTPPARLKCLALFRSAPSWERPDGSHSVRVEARDAAGNSSVGEVTLEWISRDTVRARSLRGRGRSLDLDYFPDGFAVGPVGPDHRVEIEPVLSGIRPSREAGGFVDYELPTSFLGPLTIEAKNGDRVIDSRSMLAATAEPGWSQPLRSPDGRFTLTFDTTSIFERSMVTLESRSSTSEAGAWGAYTVEPAWLPLRTAATVRLELPSSWRNDRVGLFVAQGRTLEFVGGADSTNPQAVSGRTRKLGTFVARRDTIAPRIGEVRVARARRPPRPGARLAPVEVRWTVGDSGSGLSASGFTLEIDGRRTEAEYDPEHAQLAWRPRDLAPGRHEFRLQVEDRLGNRSVRQGQFRLL